MFNYNEYLKKLAKERRQWFVNNLGGKCNSCESEDKLLIVSKQVGELNTVRGKFYGKIVHLENELPNNRLLCKQCYFLEKTHIKNKASGSFERKHGTFTTYKKDKCRCDECLIYYKTVLRKDKRVRVDVLPSEYNKSIDLKTNTHGYEYFIDYEHPLANSSGRVLYHRHLISLSLDMWVSDEYDVHHKNHIKNDNRIENLELVSSSEHTKLHNKERGFTERTVVNCYYCNKEFFQSWKNNKYCSKDCVDLAFQTVDRPSKEDLEQLVKEMSFVQIGKMFGVSDNAIRKWCKTYGIDTKIYGRGFWAKVYAGQLSTI